MALVRAKVTHIQPGTYAYRTQGEQFEYEGKPYKHVEVLKSKPKQEEEIEEQAGLGK